MSSRGYAPYELRAVQAPGMMRHGPFPAPHHRPIEHLPPSELLEDKIAAQAVEIEKLLRENQRLAATNVEMRQELGATQQEMQTIQSHTASIQTDSDFQARGLLDKIRKLEEDIRAGETVKKELQEAHEEVKSLIAKREELNREVQLMTEEMQKSTADSKRLPEFIAELEGLRQEHQKLRASFEYEKGLNIEQVEQMRGMEKNLISLAREVEKLRAAIATAEKVADIVTAEKGEQTASPYGSYGSVDSLYGQGGGYGHAAGGYANVGFGHGNPASYPQTHARLQPPAGGSGYPDGYLRQQLQLSSARAGYPDVYGRPQLPVAGTSESMNPHSSAAVGINPRDAARGGSIP